MGEQSLEDRADWYQRKLVYCVLPGVKARVDLTFCLPLYLIPGTAHSGAKSLQHGLHLENPMKIVIDRVEKDVRPSRLIASVSSGAHANEMQMLCQWPIHPLWHENGSMFDCVNDEASTES
jgi:tannase